MVSRLFFVPAISRLFISPTLNHSPDGKSNSPSRHSVIDAKTIEGEGSPCEPNANHETPLIGAKKSWGHPRAGKTGGGRPNAG
ncbi:MAG TPA: hypothetical protein VN639_08875, partial [Azonexus sp.]|nr:hypothetical protein [Azonexus sp.]